MEEAELQSYGAAYLKAPGSIGFIYIGH